MRYLKSDKKYCWSDKGFPLYDLPYYVKIISVMIILNDGKPNKGMFRHSLNVWVVFIEAVYRKNHVIPVAGSHLDFTGVSIKNDDQTT